MSLTLDQAKRYARHILLPEVGEEGQRKLLNARVLVAGTGGLGCPVSLYLAAAGVGTLGLVDFDRVDSSNLQRQVLFNTEDIGKPKAEVAGKRLRALNPDVAVNIYDTALTRDNILGILKGYDMVVTAPDNFPTRYLINDAAVLSGKPNIYSAVFRFEGQVTVFKPKDGPCYRCLYPEPPPPGTLPPASQVGVMGAMVGTLGTLQATEVIKLITGAGEPLVGKMVLYDSMDMGFKKLRIRKDPACPICGENPTIHELQDYEKFCGTKVANSQTPLAAVGAGEPEPGYAEGWDV